MSGLEILAVLAVGAFVVYLLTRKSTESPPKNIARIRGDGSYSVEVVGESFYRAHFQRICGDKAGTEAELFADAELVLEDDNPHDKKAVSIHVNGLKVGHLSRDMARNVRKALASDGISGHARYACGCRVYCGGEEQLFSVSLDLPTR